MVFKLGSVYFTIKLKKEADSAFKNTILKSQKNLEINSKMEKVTFSNAAEKLIMEFE